MRKINILVVLLAGFLTMICFRTIMSAKADDNATAPENQVLNDEGYGNDDAEYYNSEDDRVNDEDTSQNNAQL